MDELIDILTPEGKPTGKTCLKSFAHKNGLFHASVHIWIFNNNKDQIYAQSAPAVAMSAPNHYLPISNGE